jgi:hypothetical protein
MNKQTWSLFMANVIKKLLPLLIYADINIFLKTLRFFTISFDVYVKIYETAQLTFFMFLNQKTNFHFKFANVLWVAFSIPSDSLILVKFSEIVRALGILIHLFNVRKMLFHTCAVVRSVAYATLTTSRS